MNAVSEGSDPLDVSLGEDPPAVVVTAHVRHLAGLEPAEQGVLADVDQLRGPLNVTYLVADLRCVAYSCFHVGGIYYTPEPLATPRRNGSVECFRLLDVPEVY